MTNEEVQAAYEQALREAAKPQNAIAQRAAYAQIAQAFGLHLVTAQLREIDNTLNIALEAMTREEEL